MLPQNLKYQPKVESAPARRYRTNIQPQTGTTFNHNETIIINIPTRNNTALIPSESVLKFQVTGTNFAANTFQAILDSGGAHGFINRLRVFHGSNLLQDIQDYGQLAKILYDFQMPLDAVQGRYSVTSGTTNDYTGSLAAFADPVIVKPINRGRNYATSAGISGNVTLGGAGVGFSINLISLVGALSGNKYLPLWEMTSAPLRVELVLAPNLTSAMLVQPAPAGDVFQLTNVEYIGEFLELPDSAIGAIKAGSSSPLQMVLPDYRAYSYSQQVPAGSTSVSMPIPAKFSSLKSLVIASRNSLPTATRFPYASGPLGLTQYQFRIGSEVLPSNPPTTVSEWFSEASKCFGSIADLDYQPGIDIDGYNAAPTAVGGGWTAGNTTQSGGFVVGIDLESYMSSDKSSIFAGMNTNTADIFYLPQITFGGSGGNVFFTAYANYDTVLVCENGVAYTRF